MSDPTPVPIVDRFVTSPTARVFAVYGLPEELIAALLAKYSRSPVGFREMLAQVLAAGDLVLPESVDQGGQPFTTERARKFHETWVQGYGHGSVAEHAVAHVCLEGISLLAAKLLEDCRPGVGVTEQSTRYVVFSRTTHIPVESMGVPAAYHARATEAVEGLLSAYGQLTDELMRYADATFNASDGARRGWVLDRARAVLPCAVPTRVGLTLNGRAAAHMVRKLRASDLPEGVALADELEAALQVVLPTLVRHTEAEPARAGARDALAGVFQAASLEADYVTGSHPGAVRVTFGPRSGELWRVALVSAIRAQVLGADGCEMGEVDRAVARGGEGFYAQVLDGYLGARGPHERPGRALEDIPLRFEGTTNFGAWRDIQRHRMFACAPVRLSPEAGVCLPADMPISDELRGTVMAAVLGAQGVAQELVAAGYEAPAQYLLALGTTVHYRIVTNLRALWQFIELRSGVEGHQDYRDVAWAAADAVVARDPVLGAYLRVNRLPRTFARR